MNGTEPASRFFFAEGTAGQTRVCILQQFAALRAEFSVAFLPAAVEANHLFYGFSFLFYAVHPGTILKLRPAGISG